MLYYGTTYMHAFSQQVLRGLRAALEYHFRTAKAAEEKVAVVSVWWVKGLGFRV